MSYYTYLRCNNQLNLENFKEGIRGSLGIMPENTQLNLGISSDEKYGYKFNYTFDYGEFTLFPDYKELLDDRLISQTLELIESCNEKGSTLIIESIWEGKSSNSEYSSYKQTVSYSKLNMKMLEVFYDLEDYDYKSLIIEY